MTPDFIKMANGGATRNMALSPKLIRALSFLPELGVEMEVFSGGQPAKGSGGARVGSTRHDHGNAADVFFNRDGQRLDWSNPQHRPIFEEIVQRARAGGVTGIGAGDGYMRPGSMHIGFGNEGVWGAGGKGANAAGWLRSAFNGAPQGDAHAGHNHGEGGGARPVAPSQPLGFGDAIGSMAQAMSGAPAAPGAPGVNYAMGTPVPMQGAPTSPAQEVGDIFSGGIGAPQAMANPAIRELTEAPQRKARDEEVAALLKDLEKSLNMPREALL